MSVVQDYFKQITAVLESAKSENAAFETAAELIAKAYTSGNTIYIFGCTHSAILAEDIKKSFGMCAWAVVESKG